MSILCKVPTPTPTDAPDLNQLRKCRSWVGSNWQSGLSKLTKAWTLNMEVTHS